MGMNAQCSRSAAMHQREDAVIVNVLFLFTTAYVNTCLGNNNTAVFVLRAMVSQPSWMLQKVVK